MNRKPLLIGTLVLGLALPALAQQRAGGDGRALDANPQVGSGGVNAAAPQVDYRLRNDLVTGNVAGGAGFQGTIDYGAPGEFGAATGSDDLFSFRARSLPSSPAVNVPQATYGPVYSSTGGGGVSVYRSYTGLGGQTLTPDSIDSRSAYYDDFNRVVGPGDVASANRFEASVAAETTRGLGVVRDERGRALELVESPLLGVRQFDRGLTPQRPPTGDEPSADEQPDDMDMDTDTDALQREGARLGRRLEVMPLTGFEVAAATEEEEAQPQVADGLDRAPGLMLGRTYDPSGRRTGGQGAQQLRQSIFNQGLEAEEGSSYSELMRRLVRGDTQADATDPWALTMEVEQPDEQTVRRAEQEAIEAMREAYGVQTLPGAEDEEDEGEEDAESIEALLDELNYNMPAMTTLAGHAETRANQLIRQAESAMRTGDYFQAESYYKEALVLMPRDPMAQLGVAHAQLGAGLFRSAALGLRRVFERHPELIAVKYESRLLPDTDRLRWVQNELNKLAEDPQAGAEPGLLTAYVGYQIGSRQLVRYGLAQAQSLSPRDPLLPVLRQIWLNEQLDETDQTQP